MRINEIGHDRQRLRRDDLAALSSCVHMGQFEKRAGGAGSTSPAPASEIGTVVVCPDGEWPADPHAVPDWRIRQERRAAQMGVTLPAYRTRAEFEAMVAVCDGRRFSRRLSPKDAALAFANHVASQSSGETVTFSSDQLADAYAAWTVAEDVECSESHMRGKLKRLPNVARDTIDVRSETGRRVREVRWVFRSIKPSSPAETVTVSMVAA